MLVFGLRVAHVKRKTLNAFFGHSRSFAHPKPRIQNDRRDEIYNPVPFDFWFEKTCYGRELPFLILFPFAVNIFMFKNSSKKLNEFRSSLLELSQILRICLTLEPLPATRFYPPFF